MNLKDSWKGSNHNLTSLAQEITLQCRILGCAIRELNPQALGQRRDHWAATSKALSSGADLAAPLSTQSYAKPEFKGPQNRHDGEHPDSTIKDFRSLHAIMHDAMHHLTMYNTTGYSIKHMSRNTIYISDEQLHAMELCICCSNMAQFDGLVGACTFHSWRCTWSQSCHGGDRWNDWVWVMHHQGRFYGTLNGRLPWQWQQLYKINLLNEDGAFVEYWWVLALTTIPANSANTDPVSKSVQMRQSPAAIALQVLRVGNIVSCATENPFIATSSNSGDGRNKQRIVNSHIDLATWIDVYN